MAHCDEYLELISARLDGALSPKEYAELETHLAQCPECRALAEELSALSAGLRDLPAMKAPAGLSQRIADAVAGDKVVPFAPWKKRSHWKQWASCAAVLALVLLGSGGLRDWQAPAVSGGAAPEAAMQQDLAPAEAGPAARDPEPTATPAPVMNVYAGTGAPEADPLQAPNDGQELSRHKEASAPAAENGGTKPTDAPRPVSRQLTSAPLQIPAEDTAPSETETAPTETPDVAPNITLASTAPVLTEADAAAMTRLLEDLGWTEPLWEDASTALLLPETEGEAVTALTYAGRSEDDLCCLFDLTSRVYDPAWAEDAQPVEVTALGRYTVALEGDAIEFDLPAADLIPAETPSIDPTQNEGS